MVQYRCLRGVEEYTHVGVVVKLHPEFAIDRGKREAAESSKMGDIGHLLRPYCEWCRIGIGDSSEW